MTEPNDHANDYLPDAEDQLQPKDSLIDRKVDDMLDEGWSPPEKPLAIDDDDELSLDERLDRELPDEPAVGADGEVRNPRSGRLVSPDTPDQDPESEEEKILAGEDVGVDGGAASAEEAAVHVVDEDDQR